MNRLAAVLSLILCLCMSSAPIDCAWAKEHKPQADPHVSAPASSDSSSNPDQVGSSSEAVSESGNARAPAYNTSGTVRVNNSANLEALLNIIANGCEILGIATGGPLCLGVPVGIFLLFMNGKRLWGLLLIFVGPTLVIMGLATPGVINWLVASARDADLFK